MTRAGSVAALGAVAVTAVLAVTRIVDLGPQPAGSPYELIPLLTALALLCVIGLARDRSSTATWLATIGTASVVTIDLATYARAVRPILDDDGWRWLGIAVSLSALLAVGSAAAYAASRPRLRRRWLIVEGVIVLGGVSLAAAWAVLNPDDPMLAAGSALGSLGIVTRSFIVLTVALTLLGLIGDGLPAADRARHRAALSHGGTGSRMDLAAAWTRAFVDELSPGRRRARRAVLAERSRVARDIHADVVPGLRQVLADAERGVPPDRLAAALRDVLADVEAVGAVQHPVQLEIGGLTAALEWLAERVESRSTITVELDVADPAGASDGEPPPEVAAAAFRIASLALANVAHHAPGSTAGVRVDAGSSVVALSICDDGPGIAASDLEAARARGRRGIADMAAEADECGGVVDVTTAPTGSGTCVTFGWQQPAPR